ncbi:MAG TPA: protein kinase [Thermoanaerobaculia bacterium]|nr:protein kinase [Thermoanaerobaculia bacterium]
MARDESPAERPDSPPPAEDSDEEGAARGSSRSLRPGERIGAYRVERRLGRGGMGEVFLAFDDRLGRLVAIKRIRHDGPLSDVQRQRFRREARAAARLNHPALVQVFDLVEDDGGDTLVLEYVEGRTLAEMVEAQGPLDPALAVRLGREIALGLQAAHAAGFVHRDLKTENVMVTPAGRVKILDFGLVKSFWREEGKEDSLTAEGLVMGTFHTISPEQVRGGHADARSDLFSLGVLLYELTTSQSPFRGSSHVDSLRRVLTHRPPPLDMTCPGLPRELAALVERLLEKDPRRRPRSALDVAQALEEIAASTGLAAASESAAERTVSDMPTFAGVEQPSVEEALESLGAEEEAERPALQRPGALSPHRQPPTAAGSPGGQQETSPRSAGARQEPGARASGKQQTPGAWPPSAQQGPGAWTPGTAAGAWTPGIQQGPGQQEPVAARPSAGLGPGEGKNPGRPPLWVAAAALLALAAGAGYLLWRSGAGRAAAAAGAGAPVRATFAQLTDLPGSETFPSLSPDGNYFAYCKTAGGRSHIYLQRAGGGNSIDLSRDSPASDTQPAFSSDGQQIAFRSERDGGGIFLMGATGESVRRLTDFNCYNPAWSPDATEVLCATEGVADPAVRTSDSRIWRIDVATGARRLVLEADAVQPSWSPHGRRIAYWGLPGTSGGAGHRVLWTIPADRTSPVGSREAVPLVDDQYLNWSPIWAPDGKYVYFASDRSGAMNLWRVAIDEATGKPLGGPEPLSAPSPWSGLLSISRDGRRIAYATRDGKSNIERVAFDPTAGRVMGPLQPVTQGSRFVRFCDASPDGRWIAFNSTFPQEDLFIVHPDGSGLRQLTNDRYKDRGPVWSPDGSRIAFYSNRSGRYELWIIRPDGSGLEQITSADGPGPTFNPIWSPDGRKLACFLNLRGTALVDLARHPAGRVSTELPPASGTNEGFNATSWSPDGRWLAGSIDGDVVVYSFQSGRYSRLTGHGSFPHWLHDSSRLLYLDEGKLFLLDARTREVQPVLEPPASSAFYWLSIGPADRFLSLVRGSDEGHVWMLTLSSPS